MLLHLKIARITNLPQWAKKDFIAEIMYTVIFFHWYPPKSSKYKNVDIG